MTPARSVPPGTTQTHPAQRCAPPGEFDTCSAAIAASSRLVHQTAPHSEVGKYQDAPGQTACLTCPQGRFGDTTGLSTAGCSGSDGAGIVCPAGWTFNDDGAGDVGCFKHVPQAKTFVDAQTHCEGEGGHMVSFFTAPTQTFLSGLCQGASTGQDVRHCTRGVQPVPMPLFCIFCLFPFSPFAVLGGHEPGDVCPPLDLA